MSDVTCAVSKKLRPDRTIIATRVVKPHLTIKVKAPYSVDSSAIEEASTEECSCQASPQSTK